MLNKEVLKKLFKTIAFVLLMAILLASCANGADSTYSSNASSNASSNTSSNGVSTNDSSYGNESDSFYSEDNSSSDTTATSGTVSDSDVSSSYGDESNNATSSGVDNDESEPSESQTNSNEESSNGVSNNSNSNSGTVSNTGTQEHKHDYSQQIVVPPTCTEQGYTKYICNICKDSYIGKEVPKVKHNMVFNSMVDPTETTRGKSIYKCSYGCGYTETVEYYSYEELGRLISEYMLQYINEYRVAEGRPKLIVSKKITEFCEYRGQQALQGEEHWSHNTKDGSLAAEAVKFGNFADYEFTSYWYNDDGEIIGSEIVPPHWGPAGRESYGRKTAYTYVEVGNTSYAESMAHAAAEGQHNSSGHWAYVGAATESNLKYIYVGIGVSFDGGLFHYYIVVCDYNPDVKGYKHVTMDENGNLHEEWVKP